MHKILIPLSPGFEETEAITLIDILRRAKINVTTAGLTAGPITGSHNIAVIPDTPLSKIDKDAFDMILLPGGQPGTDNMLKNDTVIEIIRDFQNNNKITAAICAAPSVLAAAGILDGKNVTSYPGYEEKLGKVNYSKQSVVIDGTVMTSRGAGTAAEFAFAIIALLENRETANKIKKAMLYK